MEGCKTLCVQGMVAIVSLANTSIRNVPPPTPKKGNRSVVSKGGRGVGEGWVGIRKCKLLYIRWINNKVLQGTKFNIL